MRGRNVNHTFLDSIIIHVLKESPVPMQVLGISFKVNEETGKIINLNVVKNHLNILVDKKKVLTKVDKSNGSIHYKINKRIKQIDRIMQK